MKKYDIILADPPWPYNSRRMAQNNGTHIAGIEDEYATMSMEEMCALPIANVKAKNCVLYLWATGPKMPEAFQLMKAWASSIRLWHLCGINEFLILGTIRVHK